MSKIPYYLSLILLYLSLLLILYFVGGDQPKVNQSLQSINLFFVFLGVVLFEVGMVLGKSKNPFVFSRFFLLAVFFKMFLFVGIVMLAILKLGLDKHAIVIPSLIMYVLYTIHETYFLMRISKQEPSEPNSGTNP